jgi:hypothetical protein
MFSISFSFIYDPSKVINLFRSLASIEPKVAESDIVILVAD